MLPNAVALLFAFGMTASAHGAAATGAAAGAGVLSFFLVSYAVDHDCQNDDNDDRRYEDSGPIHKRSLLF